MKAKYVESSGGGVGGVRDGKVHKSRSHHGGKVEENQEIKAYLNKLQDLVPFMPKDRKLSKLEVITHVIDYIRDLRQTLGLPPCISDGSPFDMHSAMIMASAASATTITSPISHPPQRHPLCVISNQNVSVTPEILTGELMDKSLCNDDVDTRPVSC